MGLEPIKQPDGAPDFGIFNLPPDFDTKAHAAEWVEEGQIMFKQQRQSIVGTGMSADGWAIYKHNGKTYKTTTGNKKTFVLMFRPKQLQQDVNALCGNLSKQRIKREVKGETIAGESIADSGMLPESRLRQTREGGSFDASEGDTQMNELSNENPSAAMAT